MDWRLEPLIEAVVLTEVILIKTFMSIKINKYKKKWVIALNKTADARCKSHRLLNYWKHFTL